MKQYCRYCTHMCCGDVNYCSVKKRTLADSTIRSTNSCKYFEFNPIDAVGADLDKTYKPRAPEKPPVLYEQMKW